MQKRAAGSQLLRLMFFCEVGKGCSDWSSGGPIMDVWLGAGHCSHGAMGNGRLVFWLGKKVSLVVRDQLGGVVGSPGKPAPSFAHAWH